MATQEEIARRIAESAHSGQVDKAGAAYIEHPRAVVAQLKDDDARAVGWLHDVVEDTSMTLDDLLAAGLKPEVVDAVDAMTHRDGEDYLAVYIPRIASSGLARRVKVADLRHNMDLTRLPHVAEADIERVGKYRKALEMLEDD